jgi:N-acetylglucosaminyldiphosphoundecaprenol N-acetyl-beta-D-mannosaminyltransferase
MSSLRAEAGAAAAADGRVAVRFLGIPVDAVDTGGLLARVLGLLESGRRTRVMYVNADCMLKARRDEAYRGALAAADLVYADGIGVVMGARAFGLRLPGRSTAADFMPAFCREFAGRGIRVYLLGARPGVAAEAAAALERQAPGLVVAGTAHGYFGPGETDAVIEAVNRARPDVVLVGMGAPAQEMWITRNADRLDARMVWGVGGLFDFVSGRTPRGPRWLWDNGFEWLCRLIVEPGRLWKRYVLGHAAFVLMILWERLKAGATRQRRTD